MDRAEATGLGVAVAGHGALLAALTLGFAGMTTPPALTTPMEVSFVDEVALDNAAPAADEPAARMGEIEAPPEPAPAPAQPEPAPMPAPAPKPAERAEPARPAPEKPAPAKARPEKPAPKAKPAPPKKEPARSTGRLKGLLEGISERETDSRSTAPKAATISAAVRSSLSNEVRRQLKPHWKAPTGADAEQLRTELSISLAPNGTVTNIEVLRTTGQTASNRPQVKRHQEQAVRAVKLASPFKLPAEYYEAWKLMSPIGFDKRLSQ